MAQRAAKNSASSRAAAVPKATPAAASQAKDAALPRKALGRGLAALMPPPSAAAPQASNGAPTTGYRLLPIERVHPNREQPRKLFEEAALSELTKSIQAQGVLQPIVVRRAGDTYEIVAGERRWRAASRAGLHEIPAVIKDLTDTAALQVALIENIQRQDLDPLEEAEAYGRLIRDHALTHEQVATAVSKSRSAVTNSLRLLKLPQEVQVMLADGRLTAGHARPLMALDDPKTIVRLAEEFVGRKTSAREAENKVRQLTQSANRRRAAQSSPKDDGATSSELALQERLQQQLGTKVRLHQKNGSGRLEIFFHSLDALDALLDKIAGG